MQLAQPNTITDNDRPDMPGTHVLDGECQSKDWPCAWDHRARGPWDEATQAGDVEQYDWVDTAVAETDVGHATRQADIDTLPTLQLGSVTSSPHLGAAEPLQKKPRRRPPRMEKYDVCIPLAYNLLRACSKSADHWEELRPFCYALEASLKTLEPATTDETLLAMDRDANLLMAVSEEVWRWKEDEDPWRHRTCCPPRSEWPDGDQHHG